MSAATTRSRTPDRLCAEAVDLALSAAEEAAAPGVVGEHVALVSEGDRVVTHFFECKELGYRGWRWAVTVARASRAKIVTLDETVLLPGPDALLAPEWVPWSERLRPGDMGPGDLLPTDAEDLRLEPGYSGEDEPLPNSAWSPRSPQDCAELVEAEDAELSPGPPAATVVTGRGSIAAVAEELGMRRARVLSRYGLHSRRRPLGGGVRREDPDGPGRAGGLRQLRVPRADRRARCGRRSGCARTSSPRRTGVWSSLAYGCGGHSEAAVMPKPPVRPPHVIDETIVDPFPLRPDADSGSVPVGGTDAEDLGHS